MRGVDFHPALRQRAAQEGRATQIRDVRDRFACSESMGDVDDLSLGIAVHEQIRLGVEQHRTAHLLGPVIEVRNAAQTRLDATDDDRHVGEGLAGALGIDDHRAIRSLATLTRRGIRIVAADTSVAGVAIDHRVHVAGGNAEEQVRLAELAKRLGTVPIGLGDDADPEPLRLEQTTDDRHPKTRVIDVGIAGDDDHIAAVPAEHIHLGATHGQERGDPEAGGPVLAMTEQVACRLHGGELDQNPPHPARACLRLRGQ